MSRIERDTQYYTMGQHRKDKNEDQIVEELTNKYHLGVFRASYVGNGFPDIVVFYNGRNWFIEIKFDKSSKLTPAQIKFKAKIKKAGGQYNVAYNTAQILKIIGYEAPKLQTKSDTLLSAQFSSNA